MLNSRTKFYKRYLDDRYEIADLIRPFYQAKKENWSLHSMINLFEQHLNIYETKNKFFHLQEFEGKNNFKISKIECPLDEYIIQRYFEAAMHLMSSLSPDWDLEKAEAQIRSKHNFFKTTNSTDAIIKLPEQNGINSFSDNTKFKKTNKPRHISNKSCQTYNTRQLNTKIWNNFFIDINDGALDADLTYLMDWTDYALHTMDHNLSKLNQHFGSFYRKPTHLDFIHYFLKPVYIYKIHKFRKKYSKVAEARYYELKNDYKRLLKLHKEFMKNKIKYHEKKIIELHCKLGIEINKDELCKKLEEQINQLNEIKNDFIFHQKDISHTENIINLTNTDLCSTGDNKNIYVIQKYYNSIPRCTLCLIPLSKNKREDSEFCDEICKNEYNHKINQIIG